MRNNWSRKYLFLILTIYFLVALGFGIVNPLFEAPDEHNHFFTVLKILETGRLPFIGPEPDPWMGQEAAQPPLYYLLSALLIAPVDTKQARELVWPNPFVRLGDASWPVNVNAFVHGPEENWPWNGYVLAAHLLRALSAIIGLGTLLSINAAGRLLWTSRPRLGLLSTSLVAFLPQFGFLHSAISNDPLIIFLCSLALWQLLRLWMLPVTPMRLLGLGVTIGLAMLTKTAGLLLLPFSMGVLFLAAWRDRCWRLLGQATLFVVVPVVLVAGWLYWRNWMLYGDPTAANQFVAYFGGSRQYTLFKVLTSSVGIWYSIFAIFGWFNVRAPDWVFLVWNGLVALAFLSALRRGLKVCRDEPVKYMTGNLLQKKWFIAVWLGGWLLLVLSSLFFFMMQTPAAQGRLLFPALAPMALGLAWGLEQTPLWIRKRVAYWLAPSLALATMLFCLLVVIPSAYAFPPVVTQLPAGATMYGTEMGEGLILEAVEVETELAHPGDWVYLTLYWRARPVPSEAPVFVLVGFGRDTELAGKLQSYHGGGLYPANLWPLEKVVADRVAIKLYPDMAVPTQLRLNVGLARENITTDCGMVKVVPDEWPPREEVALARIGDAIELSSAEIVPAFSFSGEMVSVNVTWQVVHAPDANWTTFVHLGDPSAPPLVQADSPPLSGHYPTALWDVGEVIKDSYQLNLVDGLQAGQYAIWMGMYDPITLNRLPLSVDGVRQSNDAYHVGWLALE